MRSFGPLLLTGFAAAALPMLMLPAASARAAAPCSGALASDQILQCLRPSGTGGATRGIRPVTPAAPPPAASPGTASGAAPAPRPPAASGSTETASVNLAVPFGFNSADLTDRGRQELDELGKALATADLKGGHYLLAGHTDAVGSVDYNQKLSESRAQTVRQYLVDHYGLSADALDAKGFGKSRLLDPANPTSPTNRRVEVTRLEN